MTKKYKSNHGRRYSDCAPAPLASDPRRFSGGTIGPVVSGFDHYGYPIVQNFRLPAPYHLSEGRRFSSAAPSTSIMPMKLSDTNSDLKAGIAKVAKFRLKPSPTVPAAPRDLPSQFDFCIQSGAEGYFFRFRNAKNPLHGAEANVIDCQPDAAGMMICMVSMPGSSALVPAPLCEESGADKESIPVTCCVKSLDDESGQIVCPGSAYDLLLVKIVATDIVGGIRIASVQHLDLPGGGARLPVCEPINEVPEERPCCIEEGTGIIICPEGASFPLAGKKIPIQYLEFADHDGMKVARLRCGDISNISDEFTDPILISMKRICEELGGYIFPVCTKRERDQSRPSRIPTGRRHVPDICCYDPVTGTLICEGTEYHNLAVSVVAEAAIGDLRIVSVAHDRLPGGGIRVPICPPKPEIPQLPPANCCVIESSAGMTISCDPVDHPWNGRNVTEFGQCIETPNGRFCVLRWEDGNGSHTLEVPICPPPLQKIPSPSADVPPPPDTVPYLPPPSVPPAGECEDEEARRCRDRWDEMVNRPAKFTKCDEKWFKIVEQFKTGCGGPGRRASSMGIDSNPRRYGMGIDPENLQYGRFPGLRGGRRTV